MNKTCRTCKTDKPAEAFYPKRTGRFGLSSTCKICDNARSAEYQRKNRETVSVQRAQFREANREKLAKRSYEYWLENKESVRARNREYYHANKDRRAEYNRAWREENQEWLREYELDRAQVVYLRNIMYRSIDPVKWRAYAAEYSRKRQILKDQATPRWADRDKIQAIYEMAQYVTRWTGVPHHVDHIIPLRGKTVCGLHVETNLQVLTAEENQRKSNIYEG